MKIKLTLLTLLILFVQHSFTMSPKETKEAATQMDDQAEYALPGQRVGKTNLNIQNPQFTVVLRDPNHREPFKTRFAQTLENGIEGGLQQAFATVVAMGIIEGLKGAWHLLNPGPEQIAQAKQLELLDLASQVQQHAIAQEELRQKIDETKKIMNDCQDFADSEIAQTCQEAKQFYAELIKKQMSLVKQGQTLKFKLQEEPELAKEFNIPAKA